MPEVQLPYKNWRPVRGEPGMRLAFDQALDCVGNRYNAPYPRMTPPHNYVNLALSAMPTECEEITTICQLAEPARH